MYLAVPFGGGNIFREALGLPEISSGTFLSFCLEEIADMILQAREMTIPDADAMETISDNSSASL